MRSAIIGGTGFQIPDSGLTRHEVQTTYGDVVLFDDGGGEDALFYLPRHGEGHVLPPHRVNYRANIQALRQLGVVQAIGMYAVGSITSMVLPGNFGIIDQFIDFTSGRESTFFDGGASGVHHIPMVEPYNRRLRALIAKTAVEQGRKISLKGTYVCTNGPRLETPAEIAMFRKWGADYVGMTASTETILAREAQIDFAGIAYSINWAAGLDAEGFSFVEEEISFRVVSQVLQLAQSVLKLPAVETARG